MHLFNYEYKDAVRAKRILEAKGYKGLHIEYGNHGKNSYYVKDERGFIYGGYLPEEIRQAENFGRALMIPYGIVGGGLLRGGYMFTMMHPLETITGIEITNDVFNESMPPDTSLGKFWYMLTHTSDLP